MRYKLLAIDMDGTFLNEERNITEKNLMAVRRAAEAGIKVVLCSGRIPSLIKPYIEYMPKNQPIIAGNGSIILDHNNQEVYNQNLDKDTICNIIDILRQEYDDVYYHFFDGDIICTEKTSGRIQEFLKINTEFQREYRLEFRIIPDTKKYIEKYNSKVSKIEICDVEFEVLKALRNRLNKIEDIEIVGSGNNNIEITKKGLNKGSSLEILVNYYGYSIDECIAVGNDENDIEMIKKVGLGVAVQNARENVKSVADYITKNDNNNDAIAEVIEKFIQIAG